MIPYPIQPRGTDLGALVVLFQDRKLLTKTTELGRLPITLHFRDMYHRLRLEIILIASCRVAAWLFTLHDPELAVNIMVIAKALPLITRIVNSKIRS